MSAPPPQAEDPARTRLRAHFAANPSSPALWDELWASSFAPWDKSAPSPALIDLLSEGHAALAPRQLAPKLDLPGQHIPRPRALVPGCGKGYDVRLLAGYGFDTLGVEFSGTAVGKAQEVLAAADGEGVYAGDALAGRGEARVAQGDFFDDAWWDGEGFDFIYDYTVRAAGFLRGGKWLTGNSSSLPFRLRRGIAGRHGWSSSSRRRAGWCVSSSRRTRTR